MSSKTEQKISNGKVLRDGTMTSQVGEGIFFISPTDPCRFFDYYVEDASNCDNSAVFRYCRHVIGLINDQRQSAEGGAFVLTPHVNKHISTRSFLSQICGSDTALTDQEIKEILLRDGHCLEYLQIRDLLIRRRLSLPDMVLFMKDSSQGMLTVLLRKIGVYVYEFNCQEFWVPDTEDPERTLYLLRSKSPFPMY